MVRDLNDHSGGLVIRRTVITNFITTNLLHKHIENTPRPQCMLWHNAHTLNNDSGSLFIYSASTLTISFVTTLARTHTKQSRRQTNEYWLSKKALILVQSRLDM